MIADIFYSECSKKVCVDDACPKLYHYKMCLPGLCRPLDSRQACTCVVLGGVRMGLYPKLNRKTYKGLVGNMGIYHIGILFPLRPASKSNP